eukprot:scaffold1012_cov124-Isochrysis_galbana.AAC.7
MAISKAIPNPTCNPAALMSGRATPRPAARHGLCSLSLRPRRGELRLGAPAWTHPETAWTRPEAVWTRPEAPDPSTFSPSSLPPSAASVSGPPASLQCAALSCSSAPSSPPPAARPNTAPNTSSPTPASTSVPGCTRSGRRLASCLWPPAFPPTRARYAGDRRAEKSEAARRRGKAGSTHQRKVLTAAEPEAILPKRLALPLRTRTWGAWLSPVLMLWSVLRDLATAIAMWTWALSPRPAPPLWGCTVPAGR